jgi:hypothetical protein
MCVSIDTSATHLIFKFTIGFVEPTLGPTDPMIDLKLTRDR